MAGRGLVIKPSGRSSAAGWLPRIQPELTPTVAGAGPPRLAAGGSALARPGGCAPARAQGPVDEAVVLGNEAVGLLLAGEPAAAHVPLDRIDAPTPGTKVGCTTRVTTLPSTRAFAAAAQQAHYGYGQALNTWTAAWRGRPAVWRGGTPGRARSPRHGSLCWASAAAPWPTPPRCCATRHCRLDGVARTPGPGAGQPPAQSERLATHAGGAGTTPHSAH